ncbi:UDP-N-acetylenolpyruvoylglucosamine reductase [Alicycliphilus sp. B1]|nr:UDP-N-acetylenolpyruvoylglucosamine reductase [Alicycliphilus sp. B1]
MAALSAIRYNPHRRGWGATIQAMLVEKNVPLQSCNTFGIAARAHTLVRVRTPQDVYDLLADHRLARQPMFVLGGGSNIVLTGDVKPVVLKMEIMGLRLLEETAQAWVVGGRRRRELARHRGLDAVPGLAGAGEPGADPRHRGRRRRCRT